jgi:hypothetical protein
VKPRALALTALPRRTRNAHTRGDEEELNWRKRGQRRLGTAKRRQREKEKGHFASTLEAWSTRTRGVWHVDFAHARGHASALPPAWISIEEDTGVLYGTYTNFLYSKSKAAVPMATAARLPARAVVADQSAPPPPPCAPLCCFPPIGRHGLLPLL